MNEKPNKAQQDALAQQVASIVAKANNLTSSTTNASSLLSSIAALKGNPNLSPADIAMLSQIEAQVAAEEKNRMVAALIEFGEFEKQAFQNKANDLAESIKDLSAQVDDFTKNLERDEEQLKQNKNRRSENNKIIDENPLSEEAKQAREENVKSLADDIGIVAKNMSELEKLDSELKKKKEAVDKMFGNVKDEDLSPEMRKLKKEMLEEITSIDKLLSGPRANLLKHKEELTNELAELLIRDRIIEENRDAPADKLKVLLKEALAKGPTPEEQKHAKIFMDQELQDGVSSSERHQRFQKFVDDFANNKGFAKESKENTPKVESHTHENSKENKKLWADERIKKSSTSEKGGNISR